MNGVKDFGSVTKTAVETRYKQIREKVIGDELHGTNARNIEAQVEAAGAVMMSGFAAPNEIKSWEEFDSDEQRAFQEQFKIGNFTPDYLIHGRPADFLSINPPYKTPYKTSLNNAGSSNKPFTYQDVVINQISSVSFAAVKDKWKKYGSNSIVLVGVSSLQPVITRDVLYDTFLKLQYEKERSQSLWMVRNWKAEKLL